MRLADFLIAVSGDQDTHRRLNELADHLLAKHGPELTERQIAALRSYDHTQVNDLLAEEEGLDGALGALYNGWTFYSLPS